MSWRIDQAREMLRFNPGWLALGCAVALAWVGIQAIDTVEPHYARAQTRWLVISVMGLLLCTFPHPKQLAMAAWALFGVSIGLLVFLISPGVPRWIVPEVNGARSWIDLQIMRAQPSELGKIAFVLALAAYLRERTSYRRLIGLAGPFALMGLPVVLILLEPDLGTALIFPPALLAMLVAAGARLRHLGAIVGIGVLGIAVNVAMVYALPEEQQLLKPHQVDRIKAMISQVRGDRRYIQDIGYQQHKAVTLVAAGGLEGYGKEQSRTVIAFNKLPEDHNDMIFVVIVNRWGFLGGLGVLGLYLLLILSMLAIAARSRDGFDRLVPVGFAGMLGGQVAVNVGMTIGLMPITGITLPLVSYGGSSLLASFCMVGLAVNIGSRPNPPLSRPCFEFSGPT